MRALNRVGAGLRRVRVGSADPAEYLTAAGDGIVALKLTAAQDAWSDLIGADALTALRAVARPDGSPVLPDRRLVRAGERLTDLDSPARTRFGALMAEAEPTLAAYLLLLAATGRSLHTVFGLGERAIGQHRQPIWLHHHLGVLVAGLGPATFTADDGAELRLRQHSPATGPATVVILMRVRLDPAFAWWLTTGEHVESAAESDTLPFEHRFRTQQHAVADAIDRASGGALGRLQGSSPARLVPFVNRFTGLTGARYSWFAFREADAGARRGAVEVLRAALRAGVPVPIALVGHTDRRILLALSADPDEAGIRAYDPAAGAVIEVDTTHWPAGRAGASGWERPSGLLLPRLGGP